MTYSRDHHGQLHCCHGLILYGDACVYCERAAGRENEFHARPANHPRFSHPEPREGKRSQRGIPKPRR